MPAPASLQGTWSGQTPSDIHTGGIDHREIHHPNEIAQNQAFCCTNGLDDPLNSGARIWMHNNFLVERSGKMSKSAGEFLRLPLLVAKGYHPLAYRLMFLEVCILLAAGLYLAIRFGLAYLLETYSRTALDGALTVAIVDAADAPWGSVRIAVSEAGVAGIELSGPAEVLDASVARRLGGLVGAADPGTPRPWLDLAESVRLQLAGYFAGTRRTFELPLDLRGLGDWDRLVLDGARRLAYGQTASYGVLARMIGRPGAARAAGGALGRNPAPIVIPCHRIVAADGSLGGYGGAWEGEPARRR